MDAGAVARDTDGAAERLIRSKTRRGFLTGAVAAAAGYAGWKWILSRPEVGGLPGPLRAALDATGRVGEALFSPARLAPTFPRELAEPLRVNGGLGLEGDVDEANWTVAVEGLHPGEYARGDATGTRAVVRLEEIRALPRHEMVTEFKCIEGWSYRVYWAGARLADFMAEYPPATRGGEPPDVRRRPAALVPFVGMATPDGGYYVGLDMESALHPQTLLCYEMDGRPLAPENGAPLRLAIPVKYGIKNIKRIGSITYSAERPADFWAEQGYDWYAGH